MGNGSFIPNTTQVHNNVLDILLPFLREGERAVLLYIFRRTFGFGREEDSISLDQFEMGLTTHTGKRLDYGCGMKRRVIIQALAFLMSAGLIERLEGGLGRTHISRYHLCVKDCPLMHHLEDMHERNASPEEIVQILHQFRKGAKSASLDKKTIILSDNYDKGALSAPLENSAESAPNTAIKGADNDTEKVQKSNPQKNRENQKDRKQEIPPENALAFSTPTGGSHERRKRNSEAGATRLPEDWQPSEHDLQWAKDKQYDTLLDLALETEEFRNYWHSAPVGAKKLNWSKTWQNRMIEMAKRAQQQQARASPNQRRGGLSDEHRRHIERLSAQRQARENRQ